MSLIDTIKKLFQSRTFEPSQSKQLGDAFALLVENDELIASGLGFTGDLVLKNEQTYGIKLDPEAPGWGWRDITGAVEVRGVGANDPSFATYTGTSLRAYQFSATTMNEVFMVFHMPHDYVVGTDIYIHVHWSNAAVAPNTGNVRWLFDYTYAKGHNQAAFPAIGTAGGNYACPATRYQHNISESEAITISGLEPDGLILSRIYRDGGDPDDTCTDAVFMHTADVHYQSTNVGTKNKSPSFWE